MRKRELIKQSQLLKIKSQILSNLFNEKYGLRLGEFKNTTGTERVKMCVETHSYCESQVNVGIVVISCTSQVLGSTSGLSFVILI